VGALLGWEEASLHGTVGAPGSGELFRPLSLVLYSGPGGSGTRTTHVRTPGPLRLSDSGNKFTSPRAVTSQKGLNYWTYRNKEAISKNIIRS